MVEVDELKVVEAPLDQVIVKCLHEAKRPIAHTDTHNGQGIVGCIDNGLPSLFHLYDLSICHNDENVVLVALSDNANGLADGWRKVGPERTT